MRPYFPGGRLIALASILMGLGPTTSSFHRLQRGLPGYLILFAPHAFAPQRQYYAMWLPSPLTFLPISTHFTATPEIPPPSHILQSGSLVCTSQVKPRAFTSHTPNRLRALYAQLIRLTLAPSVLPRLLAQSLPWLPLEVTSFNPIIHRAAIRPS